MKVNWKHWLYGLISAIIGGAGNAFGLTIADPNASMEAYLKMAGFGAVIAAFGYFKAHPLPPLDE